MTDTREITSLSAESLVELIRTREISSLEVTSAFLDRIDALNPKLKALCTVVHDVALDQAREADKAISRGAELGALHGLPIAFKDLTPTASEQRAVHASSKTGCQPRTRSSSSG
jgi:Asp-tRNA(Asn)/Glu-tRNA(Gln) amidotransferase A subunit family amidase